MGRRCTVCDHPEIGEINRHLLRGDLTLTEIEEEYQISRFALKRHKSNHLGRIIEEARKEIAEQAKQDFISSAEAVRMIINKLPELLEEREPSFTQILEAIKIQMGLLGEDVGSPEIRIIWGKGVEEEEKEVDETSEEEKKEVVPIAKTSDKKSDN